MPGNIGLRSEDCRKGKTMEFRPHAYQQHCINKILEIKKLGLFLDMGLGKTVTTLTAVKELKYNRFLVRKVLVIAPKKVA